MVHVLVVTLTILLLSINLAPKTKAGGLTDKAHRTILAQIVQSEFSGFSEDEQFVIETFDKEANISEVQQNYLDNLSSFKPQPKASITAEYEDEDMLPTAQNGSSLVKPDIATTRITKQARTKTIEYVVEAGDSVSTIAEEFEISVSTILWANDLSAYSIIRPGQKLDILPVSGLAHSVKKGETLSSIAQKYDIDEEKIVEANKLGAGDILSVGQSLVLPGARKITYAATQPKTYTGFSAIKDIVTSPNQSSGNKMTWPTEGTRITQYYSWRYHGLDIANKTGTPIYSADAGTIELAGWGTGYGNQIVVDHGGGKKTRYAHLSKFYVKVGDKVGKGQVVAAMGNTGWSTGPHLHFEVIINNTKYNPLNYIK
jgi:LysM repeat protein